MKKNVAVLISGQSRSNVLGGGNNEGFINTFKKHLCNNEVFQEYNINIFFVTDKINKEKTIEYFGENLKGLLQLSCETIDEESEIDLNKLIENYLEFYKYRKSNPEKYPSTTCSKEGQVCKFYKVYLAYRLMIKYEKIKNIQHDYILSMRPDVIINDSFLNYIKPLENNNLELYFNWDAAYLGRYDIMSHICKLVFCYGKYNYGDIKHNVEYTRRILYPNNPNSGKNELVDYLNWNTELWPGWEESPEVQLVEHTLDYIYKNNIDFNKLLTGSAFTTFMPDRLLYLSDDSNNSKQNISGIIIPI